MIFFQKIWNIFVKLGLVFFLWAVMLVGAISLFSLTQKDVVYYGNRCNSLLDEKAITYLKQDEIIAYDYELKCNTLYLDLSVKDSLDKNKIISLLVRLSSYYSSIELNLNTQVTAKNTTNLIFANLSSDGSVSLSSSEI